MLPLNPIYYYLLTNSLLNVLVKTNFAPSLFLSCFSYSGNTTQSTDPIEGYLFTGEYYIQISSSLLELNECFYLVQSAFENIYIIKLIVVFIFSGEILHSFRRKRNTNVMLPFKTIFVVSFHILK